MSLRKEVSKPDFNMKNQNLCKRNFCIFAKLTHAEALRRRKKIKKKEIKG